MFDDRVGAILRAMRVRRGLRQVDVARLARVSDNTVSRVERGHFEALSLRSIRAVSRVLEVRLDLAPWSRHGDLHHFATSEHAGLVESIIGVLQELGWDARAEVSFSSAGERGFIDILAWHGPSRTLLVIEVKTEIVDVGELVGTFDRKRRLARGIAAGLGWVPEAIAAAVIVLDTHTNRRRVHDHADTMRTQLPSDGRQLRGFLRSPSGALSALAFWPNRHARTASQNRRGARRVRRVSSCSGSCSAATKSVNRRG